MKSSNERGRDFGANQKAASAMIAASLQVRWKLGLLGLTNEDPQLSVHPSCRIFEVALLHFMVYSTTLLATSDSIMLRFTAHLASRRVEFSDEWEDTSQPVATIRD